MEDPVVRVDTEALRLHETGFRRRVLRWLLGAFLFVTFACVLAILLGGTAARWVLLPAAFVAVAVFFLSPAVLPGLLASLRAPKAPGALATEADEVIVEHGTK